jgi:quercetin dioxygenase-like cupin family protein
LITMTSTAAETIHVGAMGVSFLLESEQSNGALTAFECDVPVGAKMPAPHSHDAFDETIYGLAGNTTFTVAGTDHEIGPGDVVFVPRGAVHGFANRGGEDARFLAVVTPGLFGPAYFREISEALGATPDGPPDLAAIAEVMLRHGLTPATPQP